MITETVMARTNKSIAIEARRKSLSAKPPLDLEKVGYMISIGCMWTEIEALTGFDNTHIENEIKATHNMSMHEFSEKHKATGRNALRKAMWDNAVSGANPTMQIWMSKNYLGFTDKIESTGTITNKIVMDFVDVKNEVNSDK